MSTITQSQIDKMRTRLGARRSQWAPQGVGFLIFRSNGRGDNAALFESLFGQYLNGGFDALDVATDQTVKRLCGLDRLSPASILMLLLGRLPNWTPSGVQQKHSRSLTPRELEGQHLLAQDLTDGRLYINRRKGGGSSSPPVRRQAPAPVNAPVFPVIARAVSAVEATATVVSPAHCAEARVRLINTLRGRPEYMNRRLKELKKEAWRFEQPDFLWHALLQSFSTWGNSRGNVVLIQNAANYSQVTYEALAALGPSQRKILINTVLRRK